MPSVDYLYPIGENNRQEILLVEWDGFIKNPGESFLHTMIADEDPLWEREFPALAPLMELLPEELYHETVLYDAVSFLRRNRTGSFPPELEKAVLDHLQEGDDPELGSHTLFEFALNQLLKESFLEHCYLIKDGWNDQQIAYADRYFPTKGPAAKVTLLDGSCLTALEQYDVTTIFLNRGKEILDIYKKYGAKRLAHMCFCLRNNLENLDIEPNGSTTYKYQTEFDEIESSIEGGIVRIQVDCIPQADFQFL